MLVLARKSQEAIKIGNDIEITVVSIEGDQVKLGITAPKEIEIHRKEVYDKVLQENNLAVCQTIDLRMLTNNGDSDEREER